MANIRVQVDAELTADCQREFSIKTRRAVVEYALKELLRREDQKKVLELQGTVEWEGDLDAGHDMKLLHNDRDFDPIESYCGLWVRRADPR